MSTKIYEGFILGKHWNDGSIISFERWCNQVKTMIEKIYNKEYCLNHAKYMVYGELNERYNCLKKSMAYNANETISKIHERINEDVPIPQIAFFFFEGKVYGSTFLDNYGIRKALLYNDYIEDFAYWDNTDPDEDVSEKEWNERERVWDSIDHWQASLQFQDYLMRSSFYLTDEEQKELKEECDKIRQEFPQKWKEKTLYDIIYNDLVNNYNDKDFSTFNFSDEAKRIVDEVLQDDYVGKYSADKTLVNNVLEDYYGKANIKICI